MLNAVKSRFLSGKKLFTILVMLVAMNASGQTGWFQQNSGTTQLLNSVYFLNDQTGFAVGAFLILKTTNCGITWIQKIIPDTTSINSIRFLNSTTGYVCGGRYVDPYTSYQQLYKTTNAGDNWNKIYQNEGFMTQESFADVFPIDSLIYLSRGGFGFMETVGSLFVSQNSGANFLNLDLPYDSKVEKLSFINSQTGWVTTTYGTDIPFVLRKIFRTTNHGQNWTMQYRDSAMANSFSLLDFEMQFVNLNSGFGIYHRVNNVIKFLKTTNSGITWDSTSLPYQKFSGMFFADANTGWICGEDYPDSILIIRTTNSGSNWHVQKKGNYSLNAVYFVNNLTGWAVGYNGVILKTVTGGVTGVQNISKETPSSYSLSQNYPNPFNSMCNVQFTMSNAGNVKLVVYDVQGREVQTLVNERLQAGTYETSFDGSALNSGVYFYKLTTNGFSETKRMLMIK